MKTTKANFTFSEKQLIELNQAADEFNATTTNLLKAMIEYYMDKLDEVYSKQAESELKRKRFENPMTRGVPLAESTYKIMDDFCKRKGIKHPSLIRMIIKQFYVDKDSIDIHPKQRIKRSPRRLKGNFDLNKIQEITDVLFDYFCQMKGFAPKQCENLKEDLESYSKNDLEKVEMLLRSIKNGWKGIYPID